ncbi:hypothetical protein [Micromonospora sp. Llam0]|nr:hypothetical protein [Micromonospora sp. Llam0]
MRTGSARDGSGLDGVAGTRDGMQRTGTARERVCDLTATSR